MPNRSKTCGQKPVPAGWIYRPTGRRTGNGKPMPTVLVATGGGGTAATARTLYGEIDAALSNVRTRGPSFEVVQAIGPRARAFGQVAQADRTIDPGGALNEHFRDADIVISTAGYNSVLELATTDTPTLLVPIPRSIDDQTARARSWATKLGMWLDPAAPHAALDWLAEELTARRRRPPQDLGPSGETAPPAQSWPCDDRRAWPRRDGPSSRSDIRRPRQRMSPCGEATRPGGSECRHRPSLPGSDDWCCHSNGSSLPIRPRWSKWSSCCSACKSAPGRPGPVRSFPAHPPASWPRADPRSRPGFHPDGAGCRVVLASIHRRSRGFPSRPDHPRQRWQGLAPGSR